MKRNGIGIKNERWTWLSIGVINSCVAVMFVAILWPQPTPVYIANSTIVPPVKTVEAPKREPVTGIPTRIEVPSVGIDKAIQPGDYDEQSQTWTLDTTAAFYATATVPVNNTNGTTLIYGHAGWGIFEALPSVDAGAEAFVSTSEGRRFVYGFESNRQVDPRDVTFLTASGPPALVLQTCSGAFDSYRTLVTFRLKEIVYG